jgi:hypothetical protein
LESIWFRGVGSLDTSSLHVQFWLFYVASLGAAAHVVSRFSPAKVWVPVLGFIALVPALTGQLMTMYADVPMGLLLMVGLLLLGVWIAERSRPHLILATLFLAASASTKNEGVTYAIVALVAAFLCTAIAPETRRRRAVDLKALGLAAAGFVALIAPWRLWVAAHHFTSDIPIAKGLDPAYITARTNRISPTLTAIYQQIIDQGQWVWLLPIAIGLTLTCLLTRRIVRLSSFYALTGIGVFLMIVWAYVVGIEPLSWWLATSANRTVDGIMFVSAAAILTLTGRILSSRPGSSVQSPEERAQATEGDLRPILGVGREHDLTVRR